MAHRGIPFRLRESQVGLHRGIKRGSLIAIVFQMRKIVYRQSGRSRNLEIMSSLIERWWVSRYRCDGLRSRLTAGWITWALVVAALINVDVPSSGLEPRVSAVRDGSLGFSSSSKRGSISQRTVVDGGKNQFKLRSPTYHRQLQLSIPSVPHKFIDNQSWHFKAQGWFIFRDNF
jgi:hypothetical protein